MSYPEKYVFIFLNAMGGVPSFYENILKGQRLVDIEKIKIILLNDEEDSRPKITGPLDAGEVINFSFSLKENQYYVQKRLGKLIGAEAGAIITDNMLALQAARLCNTPKTVFHLIHDYFYVNQNIQAGDLVDVAIAHSAFFADAIFASSPTLFANRVFYIPYGVLQLKKMPEKTNGELRLVFLGRLSEAKGVLKLVEIEERLRKEDVQVNWTIIGKGPLKEQLLTQWQGKQNVNFKEPGNAAEVYDILNSQDIFVFPTVFEGTPVSILECLANAVVTISNDLPGGIRDILKEGIGITCRINNIESFVNHIITFNRNRLLLKQYQENCFALAQRQYDLNENADNYFRVFLNYNEYRRKIRKSNVPLPRFDKPWLPNSIVRFVRSFR